MPRSTAGVLKAAGYNALDVRDHGLRGKSDDDVFAFAQSKAAVLLTGDMGFGNILHFPVRSHTGIVIAHFPNEISPIELNKQILKDITSINEEDFKGNLIILEPGKIRIRRNQNM